MSIVTANVTTAIGNVYVSGGNTAITFLTICNYGASNVTANVYVVPSGNTVGNTNIILATLPLTPTDTYQLYQAAEKILLGPGDTIRANASANTVSIVTSYTTI
jgi:hypothetical protein